MINGKKLLGYNSFTENADYLKDRKSHVSTCPRRQQLCDFKILNPLLHSTRVLHTIKSCLYNYRGLPIKINFEMFVAGEVKLH